RPGPVLTPAGMPLISGLPRPEPLCRDLPPRRTGAVLPGDRLDHLAVITPPPPPTRRAIRQPRFQPRPRLVRQNPTPGHDPILTDNPAKIRQTLPSSTATETRWMATFVGPKAVQRWLASAPRRSASRWAWSSRSSAAA